MTGQEPGYPERDRQGEQEHAEWAGWYEAQGYERDTDEADLSAESFLAGMQAQRDLNALKPAGDPLRAALHAIASAAQGSIDSGLPLDHDWVVERALDGLGLLHVQAPGQSAREELEATFRRTFALHPGDFSAKYERARDAVMAAADAYALAARQPQPELAARLREVLLGVTVTPIEARIRALRLLDEESAAAARQPQAAAEPGSLAARVAAEFAGFEADIASLTSQRNRVSDTADRLRSHVRNLRDALDRCRDAAGRSPAAVHSIASQALASSQEEGL